MFHLTCRAGAANGRYKPIGAMHSVSRIKRYLNPRTAERRRDGSVRVLGAGISYIELNNGSALGTLAVSGPLGFRTLPHVLPNNIYPRLRLYATIYTLHTLRNDNSRPQTDAPHTPNLYITANVPQVATAALGQPRRQSRLRHASSCFQKPCSSYSTA